MQRVSVLRRGEKAVDDCKRKIVRNVAMLMNDLTDDELRILLLFPAGTMNPVDVIKIQ
jgi:hypothetical protein